MTAAPRERLAALTAAALAALAPVAPAADPYAGYVCPAALATGTTNEVVVGGQGMWDRKITAWIAGGGVEILKVDVMPSLPYADTRQRKYLKRWLEALATNSVPVPPPPVPALGSNDVWRTNRWWQTLDRIGPRAREAVARDLWVPRNPLQDAPSIRNLAVLTVAVAPDAAVGMRELRLLRPDGISAPRQLEIVNRPVLSEPPFSPPSLKLSPRPVTARPPAAFVGQILPGECDRFQVPLAAGERIAAAVTARRLLPFIGDAVPGFFNPVLRVVDPAGRETAFADDCDGFDPDPRLEFAAPVAGTYSFEIADRLFRGREDFVYTLKVDSAAPPSPGAGIADCVPLPFVRELKVDRPGRMVFEVFARRLGSSADARLVLLDGGGRELARWDDVTNRVHYGTVAQAELDPRGEWDFTAPGRYSLRVEDTCDRRRDRSFARLEVRPPRPGFTVYAHRSGFNLARWQRQPFKVSVVRHDGFAGPVTLAETEDLRFERAIVPAGTNEWQVVAIGRRNAATAPHPVTVLAVGEHLGTPIAAKVLAADECDQAFAWRHLVPPPGDGFTVTTRLTAPEKDQKRTAAPRVK